jgi:hypothetical protein
MSTNTKKRGIARKMKKYIARRLIEMQFAKSEARPKGLEFMELESGITSTEKIRRYFNHPISS